MSALGGGEDFTSSSEEGVCAFSVVGRTVVRQNYDLGVDFVGGSGAV